MFHGLSKWSIKVMSLRKDLEPKPSTYQLEFKMLYMHFLDMQTLSLI